MVREKTKIRCKGDSAASICKARKPKITQYRGDSESSICTLISCNEWIPWKSPGHRTPSLSPTPKDIF